MSKTLITSRDAKGFHATGLFEAAYNKFGFDDERAQRLNERGGELQEGLAALFARLTAVWPIFGIIKVGTGLKSVPDFLRALKAGKVSVSEWAKDILGKSYTKVAEEREIPLADVSVSELDFPKGATLGEFFARAKERGLVLLPAEAGPQVALQLGALLKPGEYRLIAMEPIADSDGDLYVLIVGRDVDGALWLRTFCYHPDVILNPGPRWLFGSCK